MGERLVRNQKVRGSSPLISTRQWARSSAGEHYLHTVGVVGSKPTAPTKKGIIDGRTKNKYNKAQVRINSPEHMEFKSGAVTQWESATMAL